MDEYIKRKDLSEMIEKNVNLPLGEGYTKEDHELVDWCKAECIRQAHCLPFVCDVVPKSEVERLEYTLQGVMHSVDKWLEGDELNQSEVNRAAAMREKTLKIVENMQRNFEETLEEISEEKSAVAKKIFIDVMRVLEKISVHDIEKFPFITFCRMATDIDNLRTKFSIERDFSSKDVIEQPAVDMSIISKQIFAEMKRDLISAKRTVTHSGTVQEIQAKLSCYDDILGYIEHFEQKHLDKFAVEKCTDIPPQS